MESFLSFDSTENFRRKLILRNLKPYKVDGAFNSDTNIREFTIVDYSVKDSPTVDVEAKNQESKLIGLNKYSPVNGFGDIININKNLGKESNLGNYPFQNLINTELQKIGNTQEILLYIKNIYGPTIFNQSYGPSVDINKNKQTLTNQGDYTKNKTVNNKLENIGEERETQLRLLNKYNPENEPFGFGSSYEFPIVVLGSNSGEYSYVSNGPNETIEQTQIRLFTLNKFGPIGGYDVEVEPNVLKPVITNQGEFFYEPNVDNIVTDAFIRSLRVENYVSNKYGPENLQSGYGTENVKPNITKPVIPNQGEYDYLTSPPPKTNEEQQTSAYIKNIYNTGDGNYELLTIEDIETITKNAPYINSETTLIFTKSDYNVLNIIKEENPNGSEGSLTQDSALAQLGAKQLKKEFKARYAYNLLQDTLGVSNLTNNSIDPNTGAVSVSPKEDPFLSLGIASGKVPLLNRNYRITALPGFLDQASQTLFETSLTGGYIPISPILGQYFDYPNKNFLLQAIDNPVAAAAGQVANLATKIITPLIDSSSELFLSYTSAPTKQILFGQLFYNQYRPQYRLDSVTSPNLLAPASNFYVGKTKNFIKNAVSPKTDIAQGKFGNVNEGPVFSYGEIGKEYEGAKITDLLFGLKSRAYYDSVGLQGGFTWVSKNNFFAPGRLVGPQGKKYQTSTTTDKSILNELNKTNSSNQTFTDGSILDITQKLVDAGNKSTRKLEHVGNAINQLSKVFNDGYNELTKGSKVIRYQTPTSVDSKTKDAVGYEYCRLFTKDKPYSSYGELQKTDGNFRKSNYSILNNTYNLNIAPMKSSGKAKSTNIFNNGKVKKYMFSIENLAWRTSNRVGYRVDDLPGCEIGPNNGRIMWFPPYDLSFDDSIKAGWEAHNFLGRTEPVYTFKGGGDRTGSLSFKIVVDHPSVLNTILNKELNDLPTISNQEITKIVDSFFAGCLKYDPYDLLKKYKVFSLSDILEIQNALQDVTVEQYRELKENLPPTNISNEITTNTNQTSGNLPEGSGTTATTVSAETETIEVTEEDKKKFGEILLFFANDIPAPTNNVKKFTDYWTNFIGNFSDTNWGNKLFSYTNSSTLLPNNTKTYSLGEYVDSRKGDTFNQLKSFFQSEYDDFEKFKDTVLKLLKSGSKVSFDIDTFASALGDKDYNIKLSERRRNAILKEILEKSDGEKRIEDFYETKSSNPTLIIGGAANGDSGTVNEVEYSGIDCGKKFPGGNGSVNSIQASFCRRGKISNFDAPTDQKDTETQTTNNDNANSTAAVENTVEGANDPLAGQDDQQIPPQQRVVGFETFGEQTKTSITKLKEKVSKKLLRNLFSECDYFEMIKVQDPFIYDGIKEKIKHFHPAFHSITPEGLNSRLTFLNQCCLPGDTIPTAVQVGSTTTLAYNDVYNSAFGSPPVCVLRVGDFYHSKVLINSVTLKYTESLLDLNPEGIGVQPMIAEVTLSITFIGGHGIKEPVARLNNALSFNFYANTELYDERAIETEDFTKKFDAKVLEGVDNEVGLIQPGQDNDSNDSGNPIGTTESTFFDANVNNIVGKINYKEKMNTFLTLSKDIVKNIKNNIFELSDSLFWGGLIYYTADRKYSKGYFNNFVTANRVESEIFGKQDSYGDKIDKLFKDTEKDIENDLCPLFAGITTNQNLKNSDYRKVKRKLKEKLDIIKNNWIGRFDEKTKDFVEKSKNYVQILDQMNFILTNTDGYKNKKGTYILYNISGTSEVAPTTIGATNTYDELKNDLLIVGNDIKEFFNKLRDKQIIPNGVGKQYKDDYSFDVYLPTGTYSNSEKRFFMVFGNTIAEQTNFEDLVESLVEKVDNPEKDKWRNFISDNAGYNYNSSSESSYTKNNKPNRLEYKYSESFKTLKDKKKEFEDEYYNSKFDGDNYKPYPKDKIRRFTLNKQTTINDTSLENFINLWSDLDLQDNTFNLKKKFN
jgi:hypothetical protein